MRIEIKEKCFGEIYLMATADDIFNVVWIERNDESKWYDFDSIGHFNIELDIHFFEFVSQTSTRFEDHDFCYCRCWQKTPYENGFMNLGIKLSLKLIVV